MPTPSRWTESDGQLLRSLRESARLQASSFARACAISNAQLAELEEGGHGRFYNDQIKAHTGRNLLKRLGHEYVAPLPEPEPESDPADALPPAVEAAPRVTAREAMGAGRRNPWPLRLAIVLVVAATLGVVLMPRAPRDGYQIAAMATAQATPAVPAPPALSATAATADTSALQVASAAPAADPSAPAAAGETRCDMPARDKALPFTPPSVLRPGNYVYIESAQDTSVCVVDGENRQTVSMVKPGEGTSVYGTPPFMVAARQWGDLRMFYQGARVNLDGAAPPPAVMLVPR